MIQVRICLFLWFGILTTCHYRSDYSSLLFKTEAVMEDRMSQCQERTHDTGENMFIFVV